MDERIQATPVVAIVGRTNVGKSTLFNRLLEKKRAIMSPVAGTTRDINFGYCRWRGEMITVIDTAGLDLTSGRATEESLKRQVKMGMDKADMIVFLVDAKTGLMPQDRALAKQLQRSKKRVLLVVNKADNPSARRKAEGPEWLKLGLGEPLAISAANGSGVGDLLDRLFDDLKAVGVVTRPLPKIDLRIAIIGKPNVGKSSLLNAMAGEERVIVSEVPHTTKEPQDTLITFEDEKRGTKNILLIDTVGIRKKARVGKGLEKVGVQMSLEQAVEADVVFLMIDAMEGIGAQEKKLASLLEDKNLGVLLVVNKWDMAKKEDLGSGEKFRKYLERELPAFSWMPVAFISAMNGARVNKLLPMALDIAEERGREISQGDLDDFVERLKKRHGAMIKRGDNRPVVYGMKQTRIKPPTFMVIVKKKETLHPSFMRFIENRMRESFGFEGTPIKVTARQIRK